MSALNRPENFAGRVNYAAHVITTGKGRHGRAFGNCFENHDGDVVGAALMRRAEKNPKLAANLFRFLNESVLRDNAETYADIPTRELPRAAADLRARKEAEFAAWLAARDNANA